MTQEQYKWLQDNGYDPTVHDVDDQGNIFENPINQPAPQKEVMSVPRAFGTSFLGNLIPSAASLAGGAAGLKGGAALGAPFGPVGIGVGGFLGGVGGSLGAGYLTGKGQQAVLENYAPEAIAEMQRAETDQPVASWAGGSAPAFLTFKPSFKGISGLSAPLMSQGKGTMTKFAPAAIDVGVNAASAGAGQLVNMSEGGEFSAPRFLADTAFGSIVSNPNALGRKMGFPSLDAPNIPKTSVEQPMDLEALRATEGMTPEEVAQYKTKPQMEWWKQDEATRISDIENVAKQAKQKLNKGMADELSRLPEVYDVIKNPEKFPEFLANSLEEALNVSHESAQDKKQDKFLKLKEQERRANLNAEANEAEGYFKAEVDQAAAAEAENYFIADLAKTDADLRAQAVQAENDLRIANAKTEAARVEAEQNAADTRKLQDLDAAQALSDEAAARLQALYARQSQLRAETQNKSPAERRGVKEQGIADIAQAKQELADARAIADDLYSRLQSAGGKGLLNQADLDAATKLAAQRGLRIVPATPEQQAKGIRGAYVVNENGEGIIYINPFAATADTAIHEIGHDVFKRSPNERMRRSLMDTAEGSEAYKREYAARIAAQDENGNPTHTEQQARDIALEEGIVQAFGEAYPNVKPGEIRQWFNALKSSVKSMLKMKLSPEDAIAWMHYATTEAVPWKGVPVVKGGGVMGSEERMQGPEDNLSGKANTVRLIKTIVNQQGDLGKIEMRELVQNALDAVYKKPSKSDVAYEPREIAAEVSNRSTALVSDTGTGMSPNFLSKGYLQLSVSTKGLTEGGGFGLAKAALFGRSEEFEVRTVWTDSKTGRRFYSRIEGTPKGFYNAQDSNKPTIDLASITTQPKAFKLADGLTMHVAEVVSSNQETPNSQYLYDGPDGTAVAIKYPEGTRLDEEASYKSLSFNSEKIHRNYFTSYTNDYAKNPFHEKPEGSLFAKTNQFANMDESLYVHEKSDTSENKLAKLEEVDLANASVKTYLQPRDYNSYHIPYEVYSNGVFQYRDAVSADVSTKYPTIMFDVKSKVLGEDPNYPFTLNRNAVQGDVKNYVETTAKSFAEKQVQKQKEVFEKALVEAPKITTTKGDSVSILDVSKLIPEEVIRLGMTNDPVFGDIIEFSSLIHSIVRDNLSEAFPHAGYQGGDFAGVLTGTRKCLRCSIWKKYCWKFRADLL